MKFSTALVIGSYVFASANALAATTRYDFFFQAADDTQTSSAYVDWDGTQIVGGGGSLQDGGRSTTKTGLQGTMSSFQGSSLNQFTFRLSGYDTVFAVNFASTSFSANNGTFVYPIDPYHYGEVSTSIGDSSKYGFVGYVSTSGEVYTSGGYVIPQAELPTPVPEIDGGKLPQVAFLLVGLLVAYRSKRFFNSHYSESPKFA